MRNRIPTLTTTRLIQALIGLTLGLCLSWIAGLNPLTLAVVVSVCSLFAFVRGTGSGRFFWRVTLLAVVMKTLALCVVFLWISSSSSGLRWLISTKREQEVLYALVFGMSVDQAERLVSNRVFSVKSGSAVGDPFSGDSLRSAGDWSYSIGPDLIDDHMAITYDPSNGLMNSSGDILMKRDL